MQLMAQSCIMAGCKCAQCECCWHREEGKPWWAAQPAGCQQHRPALPAPAHTTLPGCPHVLSDGRRRRRPELAPTPLQPPDSIPETRCDGCVHSQQIQQTECAPWRVQGATCSAL